MENFDEKILEYLPIVIYIYVWLSVFYLFFYSFVSIFPSKKRIWKHHDVRERRYLLFMFGDFIGDSSIESVRNNLAQIYAKELFDIKVVSGKFNDKALFELNKMDVGVIELGNGIYSKSEELIKALETVKKGEYDVAVILGSTDVIESNFLLDLNTVFNRGFMAVQTNIFAKRLNTASSVMNMIGEKINSTINSKGQRVLSISASLENTGFALDVELLREKMVNVQSRDDYFKELDFILAHDKYKIEFLSDVYVLIDTGARANEGADIRSKWIFNRFFYCRKYILPYLYDSVVGLNFDLLNKIFQLILPPRLLLPIFLVIAFVGSYLLELKMTEAWGVLLIFNLVAYVLAIPVNCYNGLLLKGIISLPLTVFNVFKSMVVNGRRKKSNNNSEEVVGSK